MRGNPPDGTDLEEEAATALDALGVGHEEQPSIGRYRPDFRLEDGTILQVMGCYWHACPIHGNSPDTNEDYWETKFAKNRERDKRRRRDLLSEHGVPLVFWVWEHEDVPERVAALCERRDLL